MQRTHPKFGHFSGSGLRTWVGVHSFSGHDTMMPCKHCLLRVRGTMLELKKPSGRQSVEFGVFCWFFTSWHARTTHTITPFRSLCKHVKNWSCQPRVLMFHLKAQQDWTKLKPSQLDVGHHRPHHSSLDQANYGSALVSDDMIVFISHGDADSTPFSEFRC